MRNTFVTGIIATQLAFFAHAQLPQECFLHSDQMGGVKHGQYESDLPLLELNYDPDMKINTIYGLLDQQKDLVGVQMLHYSESWNENLLLRHVGGVGHSKHSVELKDKYNEDNISLIAIVYDPSFQYVCDVFIGFGDQSPEIVNLSGNKNDESCRLNWDSLDNAFVLYAEQEYPIVGFHGRKHNDRLADLGVIWLDKENKSCQQRLPLDVK